ncbi:hypothetical protein ACTFIT_010888 [Dictyostelium discoideum]
MSSVSRKVANVAKGYKTKDGAGNPNDYIAGFPSHPHRGQQTLTYMIDGLLKPGMVQVMNAARGIIHSEMPKQVEGKMFGFQFWLNLAAILKAKEIPEVITNDKKVRVVAGHYEGVEGIVKGLPVNPIFLDVKLSPNTKFSVDIPDLDHNSFVYVFEGEGKFGPEGYETVRIKIVTIKDNEITPNKLDAGENGVRFLFLSAKPLSEPIAQHGPFVMNTQKEIQQAFFDYQMGRFN